MNLYRFAAQRGLLIPDDEFRIILENCCSKDLPELLAYRLVLKKSVFLHKIDAVNVILTPLNPPPGPNHIKLTKIFCIFK